MTPPRPEPAVPRETGCETSVEAGPAVDVCENCRLALCCRTARRPLVTTDWATRFLEAIMEEARYVQSRSQTR